MTLPQLPHDKAQHALYGAAIFALAHAAATLSGHTQFALHAGAALTVAVAVGKEVLDHMANARAHNAGLLQPHSVEAMDVIATVAGGALVALPLVVRHG